MPRGGKIERKTEGESVGESGKKRLETGDPANNNSCRFSIYKHFGVERKHGGVRGGTGWKSPFDANE